MNNAVLPTCRKRTKIGYKSFETQNTNQRSDYVSLNMLERIIIPTCWKQARDSQAEC